MFSPNQKVMSDASSEADTNQLDACPFGRLSKFIFLKMLTFFSVPVALIRRARFSSMKKPLETLGNNRIFCDGKTRKSLIVCYVCVYEVREKEEQRDEKEGPQERERNGNKMRLRTHAQIDKIQGTIDFQKSVSPSHTSYAHMFQRKIMSKMTRSLHVPLDCSLQ